MSKKKHRRPEPPSPMAGASREHMAAVLRRAEAGEELTGDDAEMARAMQQHPEFRDFFLQGAAAPAEVDGMNPWLHVSLHTVVERQRRLLPEVDAALTRLCLGGLSEHEAQHRVAELVSNQIWAMLHEGQTFDQAEYLAQLRALK